MERKKKMANNERDANPIYINGSLREEPVYRQRFWSGKQNGNAAGTMRPAVAPAVAAPRSLILANHQTSDVVKLNGHCKYANSSTGSEKEGSYQPFKLGNGRSSTPLEDPYQPDYAPQDPSIRTTLLRPPSRTASLCSGYRKSEGSVVYQPLTPTNHASAWSNSLMFNKQPSELYADFLPFPPMPPPPHTMPPSPMIQTLSLCKDNLHPLHHPPPIRVVSDVKEFRKSSLSSGKQPGGLSYTPINGYISTGAPPEAYQFQKPGSDKRNNKVTLVPDGKILGEISPPGSNAGETLSSSGLYHDETNINIFGKVSALHIPLGLCLFALGIARLLLYSVWGLGIELVYGIYVVLTGIIGIIGSRRRNYCSLIACCAMSMLSCLLCIPPFIIVMDNQFAFSESGDFIPYATAGDCYSAVDCPQGRFSIDLRGTGFRVSSRTSWQEDGHRTAKHINVIDVRGAINVNAAVLLPPELTIIAT